MAADQLHRRLILDAIRRRGQAGRKRVVGFQAGARVKRLDLAAALGGRPQHALALLNVNLKAAAGVRQGAELLGELRPRAGGDQRHQQVVQLVGVPHLGRSLGPHPFDRVLIEAAELAGLHRQAAAQRYGARAALADLGVLVEVGEGGAVEDLVREHARLDRVDEVQADGRLFEAAHERLQPVDVHRLR